MMKLLMAETGLPVRLIYLPPSASTTTEPSKHESRPISQLRNMTQEKS